MMENFLENDTDMEVELSLLHIPHSFITDVQRGPELSLEEEDRILNPEDVDIIPPTPPQTTTTLHNHTIIPTPPQLPSTTLLSHDQNPQHLYPNILIVTQPTSNTTITAPTATITAPTRTTSITTTGHTTNTSYTSTPNHNTTLPNSTHTTTPTYNHTTHAFEELIALHRSKSNHLHHISILERHIQKNTTPANLHITIQPWVQLSPEHQSAWDTGVRECQHTFTTTLLAHHKEQVAKVEEQITSTSSALHSHAPDISTTLITMAAQHKTPHTHKRSHSKQHTPARKHHQPATPTSTHSPKSQDFRKRPHTHQHTHHKASSIHQHPSQTPSNQAKMHHHPIPPSKSPTNRQPPSNSSNHPPLRIPPQPHTPLPTPHTNPLLRLAGNKSQFPTIYNMFMKGGQ